MKNNIYIKRRVAFLEAILNTVNDEVVAVDRDFRIIYQNESNSKAFGPKIGEYCYEAFRYLNEPCEDCHIIDVIKNGEPRRWIRNIQRPNGEMVWVENHSAPIKDLEGRIIGAAEIIRNVTEQIRLSEENVTLRREMELQVQFENIITQSKKMKAIFRLIERVASTTSAVLINGESGTGKELIARAIFINSDRKEKSFVSVNCSAIPENLLESELFGHVKGAFTGAIKDHRGLIAGADGGILFLDEVGEIPMSLQAKLLRFLQDGECRRVGDTKVQKFDVRIISATNRNLEEAVDNGEFRKDLFFRLSVIPIFLPPLRERIEDIPLLTTHLLQRLCDAHGRDVPGVSSEALKILMEYAWPGNVRELENVIEYALHITDDGQPIRPEQLPSKISSKVEAFQTSKNFISIDEYTKKSVLALQNNHNEEQIAKILGISRKNLWEKRKRWNLTR